MVLKLANKIKGWCFVLLLLTSLFSSSVIFKLNLNALSSNEIKKKLLANNIEAQKLNGAIKIGWEKQGFYYYLDQHQFQRLFIQEWLNFFPSLPKNQLEFFYRVNDYNLPVAVRIIYTNPVTTTTLGEWKFRIAN